MTKEEFQKLIEDCQFEELEEKRAHTFPPCTATGSVRTDYLVCDDWTAEIGKMEMKSAHYEITTVSGNMHDKNGVKCDLLA